MTATFSKAVTGFVAGDISVDNGTVGSFVAVSTTIYTFNITPISQGEVKVDIDAGVAQDGAGNTNTAAERLTIIYDNKAGNKTTEVKIEGFSFIPDTITVAVGTKVTWTNMDSTAHTVSSRNALFDSGNMSKGATFSYTFEQGGTFEYYCKIHPYMAGKVIVN